MVKLATPVSHLFDDERAKKRIVDLSDCLEGRDGSVECCEPCQELFHCEFDIVHRWSENQYDYITGLIADRPELHLISFHMACDFDAPILKDGMFYPGGTRLNRKQMIENSQDNIDRVRKLISGRDIIIAIENNNFYPTGAYDTVTDAEFIAEIIETNQVRFLFDLAHARITAHNRGMTFDSYLDDLPTDRMVQLHICRSVINDSGLAYDAHELPDENDLLQTDELIDHYPVEYVTFEYYKDADRLVQLLKEFRNRQTMSRKRHHDYLNSQQT